MGYGNAYAQANVGDWGGIDARDLLAAVDAACARPDVDPDRLAVTGESYGGFMTNWLIATTDRFRAGVAQNWHQRPAQRVPDDGRSDRLRLGHGRRRRGSARSGISASRR